MISLEQCLKTACDAVREEVGVGKVADYIPALARIDPNKFGASIITVDGETASYGDAAEGFSIQSISKLFTLTLALEKTGDELWQRVGREPSGNTFNSIVQLEQECGIPRNPFINAGAILVSDVLLGEQQPHPCLDNLLDFVRMLAQDLSIEVDKEVAQSEAETGFRNTSLANFMKSFGNLNKPVAQVLELYFNQCAIKLNCQQLARAGLFLAKEGLDPLTQQQIISTQRARRINAMMLMCGHYDASGDFAFRVGVPGKSGVGGGILAIVPERAAIAVWSPALNKQGNSTAGTAALEQIVHTMNWNMF